MAAQDRRNQSVAGTRAGNRQGTASGTGATSAQHSGNGEAAPVDHDRISGVRILELTNEELARLDITVTGDDVIAYMESRYTIDDSRDARWLHSHGFDTTKRSGLMRSKVTAGLTTISITSPIPYARIDTITGVAPIVVTSEWISDVSKKSAGTGLTYDRHSPLLELYHITAEDLDTSLHQTDSDREMRSTEEMIAMLANRMIPIRVRATRQTKYMSEMGLGECTLWYLPTEAFVAALPERYSVPLREELKLLADVAERNLTPGEVCQRLTGPTFFDYCRQTSGALSLISLYPNPSRGKATCRFSLNEARTLSFALYDISGKHLRDLTDAQWMEAGSHDVKLKIEGTGSGAYLIAMKTDKGEQVVQRVIVE